MDVTVDNFKQVLEEFDEVIESASFFSIDSEFTGLNNERTNYFNTPAELYKKICSGTNDYIIIQLGITVFRLCKDDPEKLLYRSYNFYVYPQGRDQTFRCSGSSLTFLAEQKFDFNKLFQKGVSCCTQEKAAELHRQIEERQRYREDLNETVDLGNIDDVPVPAEEIDRLEQIRKDIKKFMIADDAKNIVIENCNGFQRKLIYQLIEKEFAKDVTASSIQKDNMKVISIGRKISLEEQREITRQKNEDDEEEYRRQVGLSALLQKISESRKLIVGHNMFLDLFYLFRQFFENVPETLKDFKKNAHKIFPNILDTKHLCFEKFKSQLPSSVLKHIYDAVQKEPFKLPKIEADGPEYGYSSEKEHEAGYDSYMTGVCFIAMAIEMEVKLEDLNSKSAAIRSYLNKIFIMRLTDIYFINLTGNEPIPNRDHVFHVSFPVEWKQSDLVNYFRKFGSVFIRWINATSAFVSLNNRENASILLQSIQKKPGVHVNTFKTYQKAMEVSERAKWTATSSVKRKADGEADNLPSLKKVAKTDDQTTSTSKKIFAEDDDWPQ